jgi:hypothetical protein
MHYREGQWIGNKWPSIDIEPVDASYFVPILKHLSVTYGFAMPPIIDTIDGYTADFNLLGSAASLDIDTWMFSIAFEKTNARDLVLAALHALPGNYFE